MTLYLTINLAALLVILEVAWKAISALNRFTTLLQEYPLHKHVRVGGREKIMYPHGMQPEQSPHEEPA